VLLDILGVCGVLETPHHRGYAESYIPADQRELPSRHHVDRAYPACWWTGAYGVNNDNLALFLRLVLREPRTDRNRRTHGDVRIGGQTRQLRTAQLVTPSQTAPDIGRRVVVVEGEGQWSASTAPARSG
jgi:hypothetical protein